MAGQFSEDDYVWHDKLGVGRVAEADAGGVLVSFVNGDEELFDTSGRKQPPLKKLPADGYTMMFIKQPDETRALAETNPAELIKALHADFGGDLSANRIQEQVSGKAVDEDKWAAWWKDALAAVRTDPRFTVDKNTIHYLGDMVQIADDLMLKFKNARNIKEKEKICREILKMEDKGVPVEDVKEAAITFFTGTAASTSNNIGARLEALLFLKGLDPVQYEILQRDLYSHIEAMEPQKAADAMSIITDNTIRLEMLEIYRKLQADSFIDIAFMLTKRYRKLQRDWILDTLVNYEDKTYIKQILDATMEDVPTNQQPFVWFGKKMLESPEQAIALGFEAPSIIRRFFKLLTDAHITSAFSANPKEGPSVSREEDEILKFLLAKKAMLKLLKNHSEDIALLFGQLYIDNNAISDEDRAEMLHMLNEQYPNLDFAVIGPAAGDEEISLSREAFDRFEQELQNIVEVQLPDISKAIGVAREWGDISENAEYHAAKEKQGLLMSRKRYLERLLESAKVIGE